jgi:hypothetical protein
MRPDRLLWWHSNGVDVKSIAPDGMRRPDIVEITGRLME